MFICTYVHFLMRIFVNLFYTHMYMCICENVRICIFMSAKMKENMFVKNVGMCKNVNINVFVICKYAHVNLFCTCKCIVTCIYIFTVNLKVFCTCKCILYI